MFRSQECVRLTNCDEFGTLLGDDQILIINGNVLVLLFEEFRKGMHDNGLREVPMSQIRKQYQEDGDA